MIFADIIYKVKKPFHFIKTGLLKGLLAEFFYGFPAKKITILAVTGTDGKTTSATLLYHVLKESGYKVGLISTVAAYIQDQQIDTGFHVTTPEPQKLHRLLKKMVDKKLTHVILEITSHGAYQQRIWGITPQITGLTNISHEHLDYHVNLKNYIDAKIEILNRSKQVFLNADDSSFNKLKKRLIKTKINTYSLSDRIYNLASSTIKTKFPEKYNQMNARMVYQISMHLGVSNQKFIDAINSFPGIPGRLDFLPEFKGIQVVIDFAHTPNALSSVLLNLKKIANKRKGRLIAVFGCAGLRDKEKRPMMGEIGSTVADLAIFTAEDPRTEDPWSIVRQMKEQLRENHNKIISIIDRKDAISFAIEKLAQKNDVVAILGKGHEKSMCYGNTEFPWSDKQVALEILNQQ